MMTDKELAAIVEALMALASALSWTQPSCASSVSSYLKDAWAAIDKLKGRIDEIQAEHESAIAATLGSGREKALESLVRDMWQGHDCGAGCAMYEECRHPLDDRCLMAERMKDLGIEVIDE